MAAVPVGKPGHEPRPGRVETRHQLVAAGAARAVEDDRPERVEERLAALSEREVESIDARARLRERLRQLALRLLTARD